MTRAKKISGPQGRKHYKADLSALYSAPGHALYIDTDQKVENPRCTQLLSGLKKCGAPPPLTENRKALQNGGEQFHALGDLEEGYYPPKADCKIIESYIDHFIKQMKDEVMVDLCCGFAVKDVLILEKALEKHLAEYYSGVRLTEKIIDQAKKEVWPRHIVLNDMDGQALRRAADNLAAIGYPKKNIHAIRADVNDSHFWHDLPQLADDLGGKQPLVLMLGATFNDFNAHQRRKLIKNFSRLPQGSHFLVSIDNTTNRQALKKAYVNSHMKQFFLTGTEHVLRARTPMDQAFDPANAVVEIKVVNHKAGPHIHFAVRDKNNVCTWNTIEKIPESRVVPMFYEAKTEIFALLARDLEQHGYDDIDYVIYDLIRQSGPTPPGSPKRKLSGAELRH